MDLLEGGVVVIMRTTVMGVRTVMMSAGKRKLWKGGGTGAKVHGRRLQGSLQGEGEKPLRRS